MRAFRSFKIDSAVSLTPVLTKQCQCHHRSMALDHIQNLIFTDSAVVSDTPQFLIQQHHRRFELKHLGEFAIVFENILGVSQRPKERCFIEKKQRSKIS
jgi:hypothetical protein